ncbi:MAG: hypothetical protein WC602_01600 [archaeon]
MPSDKFSFSEFLSDYALEQPDYTACQKCGYIMDSISYYSSRHRCLNCGDIDSTYYPFPPDSSHITSVYDYLTRAYFHLIKAKESEQDEASEYLKKKYPNLQSGDIYHIVQGIIQKNVFFVMTEIQTVCKCDEKNSVIDAMIIDTILNRPKIESTYIVIQTMTLFEMWLSLLIHQILRLAIMPETEIEKTFDSIRNFDTYFKVIKKNSGIKKSEITCPLFNGMSFHLKKIRKERNNAVHHGILISNLAKVQEVMTIASRFLPVFVDIFNKQFGTTSSVVIS